MDLIQSLTDFFKRPKDETKGETPEGLCPNCWGQQQYDGKFRELVEENPGKQQPGNSKQRHHHSFVYYGQHGTLDYAFSSTALFGKVQQAFIWNVNASFPANMDKDLPRPWLRFSDHDPVVVDLSLRQSSTSD